MGIFKPRTPDSCCTSGSCTDKVTATTQADVDRNLKPLVHKEKPGSLAFLDKQTVERLVREPFSAP
jgi:hypothetical protein